MWSYEIQNSKTGERTIIFGYNWNDAVARSKIDPDDWICLNQSYED